MSSTKPQDDADDDDAIDDDTIITCWCGETGPVRDLFSDEPFGEPCGGSGFLYCHCGGDLCVCHWHGQEIECPGCEDCGGDSEGQWDDDDYDDDYEEDE